MSRCSSRAGTRCSSRSPASALPRARRDPRRCRGRGLRQDREAVGFALSRRPAAGRARHPGAPGAFTFPRPMLERPGLEFSFSGLKTAVLHAVRARAHRTAARRHRPRRRGGDRRRRWSRRRCARSSTPGSTCSWSRAASAPTAACAHVSRLPPRARRARVLSAHRILHRQRGDDRGRGAGAPQGRASTTRLAIEARARWPLESLPPASPPNAPPDRLDPMSTAARRRPDLSARPHHRVHHRLHRLGAARQTDRGARDRAAGGLPARRR